MPPLFRRLAALVHYVQYGILVLLMLLFLEMVVFSQYHIGFFISAVAIGTLPGAALYGILAYKLLTWYNLNRRTVMVLFLGLAASTGAIAMSGNIVILAIVSSENPGIITPSTGVNFNHISSSSNLNLLFYSMVAVMAVISAMFQWAGISLLMRSFSTKIGKIRYWIIVCMPAVLLLAGISPSIFGGSPGSDFGLYSESKISFRVVTVIGSSALQIIWGLGYLSIAKSIGKADQKSPIIEYMRVTAYGIVLTGFAFSAPVIFATFPPFGLAGHSFLTLAAYLFSLGFYSSAISVTEDTKLRQSIRKIAYDEIRLIDSIGFANMEQQIEKKVLTASKAAAEQMSDETGVQPTLSDEDIKDYLAQVLKELKDENKKEKR